MDSDPKVFPSEYDFKGNVILGSIAWLMIFTAETYGNGNFMSLVVWWSLFKWG
jgi:hypothetical protein